MCGELPKLQLHCFFTQTHTLTQHSLPQLCAEVEHLQSEASELQAQLQSKDYFAMMYKIAATDDHTTH